MSDPLERMTNLVALLLEARTPLTYDEIVSELGAMYPAGAEARRGAFERDKSVLRDIGIPIDTEVLAGDQAGRTAYRIDRARYELSDLQLDDDERHALQLAAAAIRNTDAAFGILKLGGGAVAGAPVTANVPELADLPVLREAAASRSPVGFRYRGVDRVVHPYTLLLREGFWYVIGHDTGHDEVRTYRVDRIDGAVTVGEAGSFTRPAGFDPRSVFPADTKELGARTDERAVVRVDAARATLVERELGPESVRSRLADGSVDVEVACGNPVAFRSWLFALGSHAEVTAPREVRDSVVQWLRTVAGAS